MRHLQLFALCLLVAALIGGSLPTLRGRPVPEGEKSSAAFYFQVIHPDAMNAGLFAQGRDQAATVGKPAGSNDGDFNGIPGQGYQDQGGNIVFTGMSRGLKAVDADRIAAYFFRFDCMAHRGTFVNHLDTG